MNDRAPQAIPPSKLRVVALALIGAPTVLAIVVALLLRSDVMRDTPPSSATLGIVLTVIGGLNLVTAFSLRTTLLRKVASSEGEARLRAYGTATLIFFALLESAMLLGVIAWFLTRQPVPGVVVATLAFAVALGSLPGDDQFESIGS